MSDSVRLMNMIYTNDMSASVAFYERLGLVRKDEGKIRQWWNEFPIGGATLALHWNNGQPLPLSGQPELHLQVPQADFEALHASLADLNPSEIGMLLEKIRYFTVVDPSDVRVQINLEN